MTKQANKGSTDGYPALNDPELIAQRTYNERQKAGRIVRQIDHKYKYAVAVMAQGIIKVNDLQKELADLGFPAVELFTPDFTDPERLQEYAELSAYQG
jgi:hypothetical protein